MRNTATAALLALTLAARLHAATVVSLGFESSSELFPSTRQPYHCPAATLVDLGDRIFLAWPAIQDGANGIVATLITKNLAEVPGTRTFIRDESPASCVAAATSGSEIALVWLADPQGAVRQARITLLSNDLRPLVPPSYLFATSNGDSRLGIVWQSGSRRYLAVGSSMSVEFVPPFTRNVDVRSAPRFLGDPPPIAFAGTGTYTFDAVAVNAVTSVVSVRGYVPGYTACNFARPGCATVAPVTALAVVRPHTGAARRFADLPAVMPPSTVACTRTDCLAAWPSLSGTSTSLLARWLDRTEEIVLSTENIGGVPGLSSASDGDSVLVVWEPGPASIPRVMGVVLRGTETTKPFVIAEGADPRRQPVAISTGPGTFLVAYEIADRTSGLVRVAGRYVFLDAPTRRRATR